MKNRTIDFSEIDVKETSVQHLNGRLAFICRELQYKQSEIEELKEEKNSILTELKKRSGGQNNV